MEKDIALLLEKCEALIHMMEERDAVYARILQMRQKAEITDEELQKIRNVVENTQCGLPDTSEMESKITSGVTGGVRHILSEEVRDAIRSEYVPSERVETLNNKLILHRIVSSILVVVFVMGFLMYRNSERYWGGQYIKVAESEYLTSDEEKALWKNIYVIEALPHEFVTNPAYVKIKIKQNLSVLKERKRHAKANKGQWSAEVPIER